MNTAFEIRTTFEISATAAVRALNYNSVAITDRFYN